MNKIKNFVDFLLTKKEEEEDDEQKFIKKEGEGAVSPDVDGIRPESWHQRNLDREQGGVEKKEKKPTEPDKDVWDNRAQEIAAMNKAQENSNNASTSDDQQSFIHMKKQHNRKKKKKGNLLAEESLGFVEQLKRARKARVDRSDENDRGGGIQF